MIHLKKKIPTFVMILFFVLISFLTGCFNNQTKAVQNSVDPDRISLVATTTMLADLAETISGGNIDVICLMGPGIDPHLYQASAGNVTSMQNADVVLYNGLHLEGKMGEIFGSLESGTRTVICIEHGLDRNNLLQAEDDENSFDPHIWFDVANWKSAAQYFTVKLSETDPKNATVYEENLTNYLEELDDLDEYIKSRVLELPENQRVLITAHDAFRYFGKGYGFSVKGLQGISTDAEAGTSDVSNLAKYIADHKIKAVFVESSVPPKTIEALQAAVKARGFDVAIGGELYSDSLGDKQSGDDTYILTFKANIDTIVDALK